MQTINSKPLKFIMFCKRLRNPSSNLICEKYSDSCAPKSNRSQNPHLEVCVVLLQRLQHCFEGLLHRL